MDASRLAMRQGRAQVGVRAQHSSHCSHQATLPIRHDLSTQKLCFHAAIANILEISLEAESPLFSLRDVLDDFDMQYEEEAAAHG